MTLYQGRGCKLRGTTTQRYLRIVQELGFTLAEIREFLQASDARQMSAEQIRPIAEAKLADLDARIRDLRSVQRAIRTVMECGASDGECPSSPRSAARSTRPSSLHDADAAHR